MVDAVAVVSRGAESIWSTSATPARYVEIAANGAVALLAVATALLDRQLAAQAESIETVGGFTERLYRVRSARRTTPRE